MVERRRVIFLPGGVMPASMAYAPVVDGLASQAECVLKEPEIFAREAPSKDYSLDLEVDGLLSAADEAGFERFDLYGYSLGGAIALAATAAHPHRVASLAMFEPAPIRALNPNPDDDAMWVHVEEVMAMPPEQRQRASSAMLLQPGVKAPEPPPGPPPPWLEGRLGAFEPIMRATWTYPLDLEALRAYSCPVWLGLGTLSNDTFQRQADALCGLWSQLRIEHFDGLHHLLPAHRAEPGRIVEALQELWSAPATSD